MRTRNEHNFLNALGELTGAQLDDYTGPIIVAPYGSEETGTAGHVIAVGNVPPVGLVTVVGDYPIQLIATAGGKTVNIDPRNAHHRGRNQMLLCQATRQLLKERGAWPVSG